MQYEFVFQKSSSTYTESDDYDVLNVERFSAQQR